MTDAYKWLTPISKPDWEMGVEMGGCTGSPNCAGAVHIRNTAGARSSIWAEVHLTPDEIRWLRRQLKRSLRIREQEEWAAVNADAPDIADQAAEPEGHQQVRLGLWLVDYPDDKQVAEFVMPLCSSQTLMLPATADSALASQRQYRIEVLKP